VRQYALLDLNCSSVDLAGIQLMTCDYIKDTEGHYMPRESFLNLRKYERMISFPRKMANVFEMFAQGPVR